MTRKYGIDPYTPEELKQHLRDGTIDNKVYWSGEYGIMRRGYEYIVELERKVDALENEVNAVEWMNGQIEKELFDCRKRS